MNNPIECLVSEAMKNIKGMIDVNTIIGDVVTTPDGTTIIPVSRVAFGFGAGGSEFGDANADASKKFGGGSGAGVSINPVAFLIVNKDQVRILPVDNAISTVDRIVDAVPDVMTKLNKFLSERAEKKQKKQEKTNYSQVQAED